MINRRRALLVGLPLLLTFVVLRVYLYLSPSTNLDIGDYNIHHLYLGLFLLTVSGLPLVLFYGDSRRLDVCAIVFGCGLGMALDEWVYLIATDGSDAAYLLPISFWGGAVMTGFALAYILILAFFSHRSVRADPSR